MREHLGRAVAFLISNGFRLMLPVLPVLAALAFLDTSYLRDYRSTLRKFRVHIRAIGEGPAVTFFSTALGARTVDPEVQISGHCVQCGNCCMNHRCAFLVARGEGIFQCGIYTSFWRRFSNCSAFPVSAHDIERYACPSYVAVRAESVRIIDSPATSPTI